MRTSLTMTFLLFYTLAFGQKSKDYLIAYVDTTSEQELIGYKNTTGEVVIKAEFIYTYTDTFYFMAIVLKNGEWLGIDREQKIILKPFIYDNGPDYIEEGLFRFVENEKIGFATIDGEKIIEAKYDFASPFENGLSEYTLGGHKEYENGGEYWFWTGGYENGFMNKTGQKFTKVTALKDNKREAWTKNNKHVLLDTKGEIIKKHKK